MTKREAMAVEVLRAGGYFRKALERSWQGGEKFVTRLRTANGQVVKGVGASTRIAMEKAGMLVRRECARSSVWPEEWSLKA